MVRWVVERRAPKTTRIPKWMELSQRLADTIRNRDLSEGQRNRLVQWIDDQIDRRSILAKEVAREERFPMEFDASIIVHSAILSEDLYGYATESMRPLQAIAYADRLEKNVDSYFKEKAQKEQEVNLKAAADVMNAVKWITFWTSKGFGFQAQH